MAPRAYADSSPQDRAAADALYEDAGKLAAANRWAEACPKLEASLKLDAGIGTLLRLGYCYEKTGRTASAWTTFNDALGMAQKANDKRAKDAAEGVKRLEPTLARLTIEVAPGNAGAGLEIRRDGTQISTGALGTPVPVDAGAHVFEATQPGKQKWTTTITIEARPGVTTVRVPVLADAPPEAKAAVVLVDAGPLWSPQRVAGASVAGAGLVGLAVGAIFGAKALSRNKDADAGCRPQSPDLCTMAGVAAHHDALTSAHVSTASLVVGAAAVGAGLAVFFTAPRASAPAAAARVQVYPTVGAGVGGLALRGSW
jgi:hypothetical protein